MTAPVAIDPVLAERLASALGDLLRGRGFDEARLRARLRALVTRTTTSSVAVADRRLGDDALAQVARFWYLGLGVDVASAQRVLGPLGVSDLAAAGVVESQGERVIPSVRIAPMDDLLIAHDFDRGDALQAEHVLGIGSATRTLAALAPRTPVARSLDLGTGNGAQALLLARHSERVVATDLNPRAVALARFNVALNGGASIDVRAGDAFTPVVGETFDLIVANPPFVVSPDQELTFRDAPGGGEYMSRAVVEGARGHLSAGGIACVLANWVVPSGDSEVTAPLSWVADLDCDSLILHHDTLDPVAYAERWMLVPASQGSDRMTETLDRWLRHYERSGAAGIASGAIILLRTGAAARTRVLRMRRRPRDGGEHVLRILGAFDRFGGPDDPALVVARFRSVEPHDLEQRLRFEGGSYHAGEALLRLERSAGVEARLPADLLEALFLVDGERSLGDILDQVATARGTSPEALRSRALPVFLRLFERGYLTLEG